MWPLDLSFAVADAEAYETLLDAAPPAVLAVLDAPDGLYVLFDEPVVEVDGVELSEAVTVTRSGSEIAGTTERLGAQLLKWTPDDGAPWYPQQRYQITQLALQDMAPSPATVTTLPGQFTHLATSPGQTLVAWSAPDHSERIPESRYGLTSLFQGRTWHDELGLYYYRARWYGVNQLGFLERDPLGYFGEADLYLPLALNSPNVLDPIGTRPTDPSNTDLDLKHQEWMQEYERQLSERIDKGSKASFGMRMLSRYSNWATTQPVLTRALKTYVRLRYGLRSEKRQSFGLMRNFTAAWPFAGVVLGDNVQFFERPNGKYAVGIFGYETLSNWQDWHESGSRVGKVGRGGPLGIVGVGISAGYGFTYGISRHRLDNYQRSTRELVDSWTGPVNTLTVAPFYVTGSFSESRDWVSVSASAGPSTPLLAKSRERYHRIVGPLVVSSEVEAGVIIVLYQCHYHWIAPVREMLKSRTPIKQDDFWFGDPEVDPVF
jgi:RHS repeat-associated protein